MCEFCQEKEKNQILGRVIKTSDFKETAGYNTSKKDNNSFLEMFISKCKDDERAGLMIDNGFGNRFVEINYCFFCGRKLTEN